MLRDIEIDEQQWERIIAGAKKFERVDYRELLEIYKDRGTSRHPRPCSSY